MRLFLARPLTSHLHCSYCSCPSSALRIVVTSECVHLLGPTKTANSQRLRRRPQWLASQHSHKLDTTGVRAQGFKDIVSHWQLCQSVGATLEILPSAIVFVLAVLGNAWSARHLSCCELLQVYWCQKKINAFIIV